MPKANICKVSVADAIQSILYMSLNFHNNIIVATITFFMLQMKKPREEE